MKNKINIAIDGPAASGKSAAALLLAKKINYVFLDTGIIYRAFTLFCLNNNLDLENEELINSQLNKFKIEWINNNFVFNGKIVSDEIYSARVSKKVPLIAKLKIVRVTFVAKIQSLVQAKGFIVVGRDITSVVLPDAQLKIFLTSSLESRSLRRWKQYVNEGIKVEQEDVYEEMKKRDYSDKNRDSGALKIVDDAIVIDNSQYSLEQTVDKILSYL